MNLKNLFLTAVIILTAGCNNKKEPDQTFIDRLWTQTVKIVGISPKTPKPKIVMMDEDLYQIILQKDCESESGKLKNDCLAERKRLENSVLLKTGKKYSSRYSRYIRTDRKSLNAECVKYPDKESRGLCRKNRLSNRGSIKILGRTFLKDHYIEIYSGNIWKCLVYLPISYAKKESFLYGVIAHEMLHAALKSKRVDAGDHHRIMRDKYMDPLMNFISDHEKTDRNGFHRKMIFDSLELGIAVDEKWKRINRRKK